MKKLGRPKTQFKSKTDSGFHGGEGTGDTEKGRKQMSTLGSLRGEDKFS